MVKAVGRVKKLHDTRPPCTVDEKLSLCLSYLHCFRKGSLNTCRKILLRYTDLINKVVDLAPIQPFYQLISNLARLSSEEEVNLVSAARETNPDYASVKKRQCIATSLKSMGPSSASKDHLRLWDPERGAPAKDEDIPSVIRSHWERVLSAFQWDGRWQ